MSRYTLPTYGPVSVRPAGDGRLAVSVYSGDPDAGEVVVILRRDGNHRIPLGLVGSNIVAELESAGVIA